MASDREIERIRKDKDEWRRLALRLLTYAERDMLLSKDACFLESILAQHWDELSYRQTEWLLDIRRSVDLVSDFRGYSLRLLIKACFENRFAFEDEEQAWLVGIYESGQTTLRFYEGRRVYGLARRIGEVDDWAA